MTPCLVGSPTGLGRGGRSGNGGGSVGGGGTVSAATSKVWCPPGG